MDCHQGTLVYLGDKRDEPIHITVIDYGVEHFHQETVDGLEDCVQYTSTDSVTWINIIGIDDLSTIETLGDAFNISSQVTNWSFRDLTLRIKVSVGVAYGSDIERVRSALLEIAGKTEKVLAYPRPDVIFSDFGDSALVFVLRLWTDVDNMLKVGTAIRFEIDRLFRERNIEIAFPQRDIHIRSSVTAQPANRFTVAGKPPEKKETP